jgi:uncharacterized protein (TIGR02001 family)
MIKKFVLAALAIVGTAGTAEADTPIWNFSLTAASDYLFRGVSQTENGAAGFAAAKMTYDDFYAGVGGENVDFHNGITGEYDLSAGWAPNYDGFDFNVGAIRYGYINSPAHVDIDTVEVLGAVSHAVGPFTAGVSVHYTPNYFGTHDDGTYYEANLAYPVPLLDGLSLSGAIGRQEVNAGGSYSTWNIGGTYAFLDHLALGLRYVDTDEHRFGKTYDSHVVGTLTFSL